MPVSPFVSEVTGQTFQQSVIDVSHRVPVLADFWAAWCGPCQMQMPVLLKLADEYQGKFLVAKINTDEERELANRFGIRSLPTMKIFRHGEAAEDILGAQTESVLRAIIERYIERESDKTRREAQQALQDGNVTHALELLRNAAGEDPANTRISIDLARLEIQQGNLEAAREVLDGLPREVREDTDTRRLLALFGITQHINPDVSTTELEQTIAGNSDDLDARLELAAHLAMEERYESAMDQYLEVLKRDRQFKDDAGRKGMLAMFELLGNEGELVSRYRRQMSNVLL